jgi:hypothetical protein
MGSYILPADAEAINGYKMHSTLMGMSLKLNSLVLTLIHMIVETGFAI